VTSCGRHGVVTASRRKLDRPYESALSADDRPLPLFPVKGRCHGNQLILGKCHERRLIPLAFFALLFENELQYHCLNVRINSGDDVATACKNVVNFCRVTPEITSSLALLFGEN